MGLKLAIVGATGLVGQELLRIIELTDVEIEKIGLYASKSSSGKAITVRGNSLNVQALESCDFRNYDAALFSVGDELSAEHVPKAIEAGCAVVDKSNAFRLDPAVPLIVPGVNSDAITSETRLVANPNCTTIILSHALAPLKEKYGLKQVFAATYQSISGAGKAGITKLFSELGDSGFDCNNYRPVDPFKGQESNCGGCLTTIINPLPDRIAHNVQPQIGKLDQNLRCGEEVKLMLESRKILGLPNLPFFVHSVRVPVPVGHSIAVTFQTERAPRDFVEISSSLVCYDYVEYGSSTDMPSPLNCAWRDFGNVEVGRLRKEEGMKNGWSMFVCGDNLRIGAALNGWRILALMAQRGIVPHFCH